MTTESLSSNIKAILFDLDGTLIDVDLKSFIPGYLKLLAKSIAHLVPPKKVISKLFQASEAVNDNKGERTNEEIFIQNFFPIKGYTYKDLQPFIDKFYESDFVKLRKHTNRKPEARDVVQAVFNKGYDVVIATTPVLPLTAIKQRLDWAGVGDFSYNLITSIENTRANKPNLLYYKQIFEFLGHSAKNCLMVGDEEKDLIAAKLGCHTFLVMSPNTELTSETPPPTYQGTLRDLKRLL